MSSQWVVFERMAPLLRVLHTSVRERGIRATVSRVVLAPKRYGLKTVLRHLRNVRPVASHPAYRADVTREAGAVLFPRVLIVAELSLAQCRKYRVDQKCAEFEYLGIPTTVVDWGDAINVRQHLSSHTVAIFYRVPGYASILQLIAEAKRLGVVTMWEVDDLIFDMDHYLLNRNLDLIDPDLKKGILFGIPLYRAALLACDYTIASTGVLAQAMKDAGSRESFVVENGLDDVTLSIAATIPPKQSAGEWVTLVYGSGSKAHNADWLAAADAVVDVLLQRPNVRLRIIGELALPEQFDNLADRVERLPFTTFEQYLQQLAESDISLAPLEDTTFNDAKSNIKYLEASIVGVPSVCSPRAAFRSAIEDGRNGLLADTRREWTTAILRLVDDAAERLRMGEAARAHVSEVYAPATIARRQLAPIVNRFLQPPESQFRVLIANVFFAPQSFGGATIVAEEMASRLNAMPGTQAIVFTSRGEDAPDYALVRYEVGGIPVIAMKMPTDIHAVRYLDHANARMTEVFGEVLDIVRPDVVHLHSIQGLSASLADACILKGVPYVITLHDAWWLCERQFMVDSRGKYCFQSRIDHLVCAKCVPDARYNEHRAAYLRRVLDSSSLLLAPSSFQKELHLANGIPTEKIAVNKNGIRPPLGVSGKSPSPGHVRFGFVGGTGPIKGIDLIRRAFENIELSNYELLIVDNTLNLGFSSVDVSSWQARGEVKVVPAYTRDSIDKFFAEFDVLLFPSQWKESFGLTVREALVRDKWVIATAAGAAAEEIVPGENGTIIPITDDVTPLREAIVQVLGDPGRMVNHQNLYKSRIVTFDEQARELHGYLSEIARERTQVPDSESRQRGRTPTSSAHVPEFQ